MSDLEHIPVRPNINSSNYARKEVEKPDTSIFLDKKDPDIQRVLTKKSVLDMKTEPTQEEKTSEKSSYVVIALCIVIVILIAIIVYYVLQYNNLVNEKNTTINMMNTLPFINRPKVHKIEEPEGPQPQKIENKASEEELDDIMERLNKNKEESNDKKTEELEQSSDEESNIHEDMENLIMEDDEMDPELSEEFKKQALE